jgi:hypothetical protein
MPIIALPSGRRREGRSLLTRRARHPDLRLGLRWIETNPKIVSFLSDLSFFNNRMSIC